MSVTHDDFSESLLIDDVSAIGGMVSGIDDVSDISDVKEVSHLSDVSDISDVKSDGFVTPLPRQQQQGEERGGERREREKREKERGEKERRERGGGGGDLLGVGGGKTLDFQTPVDGRGC